MVLLENEPFTSNQMAIVYLENSNNKPKIYP